MNIPIPSSLSTTLGKLPLADCRVSLSDRGSVIEHLFEQNLDLPGVIVVEDTRVAGVISRRRFHECISKGFSQEIFLKRPIRIFLEQMSDRSILQMSLTDQVQKAMQLALSRSAENWYEPILVVDAQTKRSKVESFFLLSFDVLLVAQSEILTVVNHEIEEQALQLAAEQKKVSEYAQLLERQQAIIQERNQLLEVNQTELLRRSQEVAQLNQRFVQIGQILSVEGKKAFQATFESANAICRNTGLIMRNGRLLNDELDTVRSISKMIEKVSHQVRHLAIQAAIVANQCGSKMHGFSHITEEIGKLGSQTFEAGRQVELIASRLESRIQELTDSAQSGTAVARSLIGKIERTQVALTELEELIQGEADHVAGMTVTTASMAPGTADEAHAFVQRIALLEDALSELKNMVNHKEAKPLVRKIQTLLERNQPTHIQEQPDLDSAAASNG